MLIRALSLWVSIQQEDVETDKQTKEQTCGDKSKDKEEDEKLEKKRSEKASDDESEEIVTEDREIKKRKKDTDDGLSIVNMGANYLLVHLLGYIVMNSPVIFSQLGAKYYNQPSEFSVYCGLIAVSVVLVIVAPFLPRMFRTKPITHEEMSLVNILVLIELATVCLAIGMHNFSLGFILATIYTPLALVVSVVENGGRNCNIPLQLKRFYCLLLQPLCLLSLCTIAYSRVLFPEEGLWKMVIRGKDAALQTVMFSIVDSLIYGNWLYNVAASILLPTWIIFWQILCNKVETT
ncbi:unnamed protein product [Parnassius apollo]|uniref:(apollo) hypothetical protein n=1 Tax=Parnassius apollo TaxID=110799 RepID=A0A8S3X857_PARAO|nr:unnamed protein product [Parnassius apollo]